ncbi:MAG TPA: hypothetical protein VG935_04100 [Patescibacteria group bacterium]|nr:hypothetical protein [Patescibacteria group bacterium]
MFYRLIVIKNSLNDLTILNGLEILSQTSFATNDPLRSSRMLKVRIPEERVEKLVKELKQNLISPYYAHLYHEDPKVNELIVVFQGRSLATHKNNFQPAVEYGLAHGVTSEEMDITPRDITQETW